MSLPVSFVGELEISSTSDVLQKPIHILHIDGHTLKYKGSVSNPSTVDF